MKELNQLLEICIQAFNRSRELILYSSNKPNIDTMEPHRGLLLTAKRKRNPELSNYKQLVRQLNLYIDDDIAPNNFLSQKVFGYFDGILNPNMLQLFEKIDSAKDIKKTHHKDKTFFEAKHRIENSAKNAIKYGIGNCGEFAELNYVLLLECSDPNINALNIHIEYMKSATGDHSYVVVNRAPESKLNNLKDWGKYALIIDGWDGDIMYAESGKSIFNPPKKRYYDYYNYIINHNPQVIHSGYIGEGLSKRFIEHAKTKNRPNKFTLWESKYTGNPLVDKKAELHTIPNELQHKSFVSVKKIVAEIEERESLSAKKNKLLSVF